MSDHRDRGFAIVGPGQMGGNLALQALGKGFRVVGTDTREVAEELLHAGLTVADSLSELARLVESPRIVLLCLPAGRTVDTVLDELCGVLDEGDIVADGGNSCWGIRSAGTTGSRGAASASSTSGRPAGSPVPATAPASWSVASRTPWRRSGRSCGRLRSKVVMSTPADRERAISSGSCTTASNSACCRRSRKVSICSNTIVNASRSPTCRDAGVTDR